MLGRSKQQIGEPEWSDLGEVEVIRGRRNWKLDPMGLVGLFEV